MKAYTQSRTCGECGQEESRILLEADAAFEETRRWSVPCRSCGSNRFSAEACPLPEMNRELFERWIHDPDLTVLSQDEDLMIGTGENLDLLEEFLKRRDALPEKRLVLLSAICAVLYDNSPDVDDPDDSHSPEFATKAIDILRRNMDAFNELNDDYICDYIKEVVYPLIGRPIKSRE